MMVKNTNHNIVLFENLKKHSELTQMEAKAGFGAKLNTGICRIIYKDIIINFWHKDNAYTCNVERGN